MDLGKEGLLYYPASPARPPHPQIETDSLKDRGKEPRETETRRKTKSRKEKIRDRVRKRLGEESRREMEKQ